MRKIIVALAAIAVAAQSAYANELRIGSVVTTTDTVIACDLDRIKRLADLAGDLTAYRVFVRDSILDAGCIVIPAQSLVHIEGYSLWNGAVQIRVTGATRSVWAVEGVLRSQFR